MRKAFNFFHSYYDVAKELNDKDRLLFLDALLKKQFEGINPELSGMAKFAYLSQKHSIETQIKGYFDKTKDPMFDPCQGGMQGGTQGGSVAPSVQEKEKGKEEVQEKEKGEVQLVKSFAERKTRFLDWFNNQKLIVSGKKGNFKTLSADAEKNLKKVLDANYSTEELNFAFENMCKSKWVIDNDQINPSHFLRINNLEKYLNSDGINKQNQYESKQQNTRTAGQNDAVEQFKQRIISSITE